jgi:hypothetical protein
MSGALGGLVVLAIGDSQTRLEPDGYRRWSAAITGSPERLRSQGAPAAARHQAG